ncbi:MAG: succinylglutamate desuccinylase/aspartoacylase family protein [Deltaproteobacteria bacterium]
MTLPVIVMHGATSGPTLWLSGAVHGDELNGVMIVDELVQRLDPGMLSGTVLAVPVVNGFGLIQGSRYLPDRRDLNRCFPGSKRGSLGARLAYLLSRLVIARCDLGIDFHSGSDGRHNLPQIRCDLNDERTRRLALAFGAPLALHAGARDGSLRGHAMTLGKPVLSYEGGEANRLDDAAIRAGVYGTLRVMAKVGLLTKSQVKPPRRRTRLLVSSSWVRATRSGFCRMKVRLGVAVKVGELIAQIVDPALGTRTSVKSTRAGIAIGKAVDSLVTAGDALLHVADKAYRSG